MAQLDSKPTSDNASYKQWSTSVGTTHYTLIDEAMANKNTSDYVYAPGAGFIDQYGFSASAPSNMVTVTDVNIDLYCKTVETTSCGLRIKLMYGAVEKASSDWQVSTYGAWQVLRFAHTGLSITRIEYLTLQVYLQPITPVGNEPHPTVM